MVESARLIAVARACCLLAALLVGGCTTSRHVAVGDNRFGSFLLPRFYVHAIHSPAFDFGGGDTVEIRRLTDHALLLPNTTYATRNLFDAACRLAGIRPIVQVESRSASTLLALADAGLGIAVIPSILRVEGRNLRIARVMHRGEPLQIAPAVIWDKRRTLWIAFNGS